MFGKCVTGNPRNYSSSWSLVKKTKKNFFFISKIPAAKMVVLKFLLSKCRHQNTYFQKRGTRSCIESWISEPSWNSIRDHSCLLYTNAVRKDLNQLLTIELITRYLLTISLQFMKGIKPHFIAKISNADLYVQ